ncbi:MAG: hypothetical protein VXY94_06210 [Planctomycetota bacterium]|nr:hypothetical protein [Planctomycetota bacterium]MEC8559652.1 hypothetical protein [Planctomycetota bacterium]MEC9233233.1 hypothetical protein [Planctomycetota bacterium]
MEFSHEQLQSLTLRSEGWKSVWTLLWEALYERLQGMLINGPANDPDAWTLNRQYSMLRDTSLAQDFIAHMLEDYRRRAELGTLLAGFEGAPGQVLVYLAAPKLVRRRALDFAARHGRMGITGMPRPDSPESPRVRSVDLESPEVEAAAPDGAARPRGATDLGTLRLNIAWNPGGGVDARVRMAALQCWPRLDPRQVGLDLLESDLRERIDPDAPRDEIDTLLEQHRIARRRLTERLRAIDDEIHSAPRMHAPRRQDLDDQRVRCQVDLILEPLLREQVQRLLSLSSPEAAYQQLSRYRKAHARLFPSLKSALQGSGGGG